MWRSIADQLHQKIREGTYQPGQSLPTEPELCTAYAVHRNTVRRALQYLRDRQIIRVEHGRGSFVNERMVHYLLGSQSQLSTTLPVAGRAANRVFLRAATQRAGAKVAIDLSIQPTDFVRRLDTIGLIDGLPMSLSETFFPLPRFHGIDDHFRQTRSFSKSWAALGVPEFHRVEVRISATLFSKNEAELLHTTARSPALSVVNVNRDADGAKIMVSYMKISPKHVEYVIRFDDVGAATNASAIRAK